MVHACRDIHGRLFWKQKYSGAGCITCDPELIGSRTALPNPVMPNGSISLTVSANDPDGDNLAYTWTVPTSWTLASGQGTSGISITAPNQYAAGGNVSVTVSDGNGGNVTGSLYVSTSQLSPQIKDIIISPNPLNPVSGFGGTNTTAAATVSATDPEGNILTYRWSITSTTAGWGITGYGITATITAPLVSNNTASVTVIADNGKGVASFGTTSVSTGIVEANYYYIPNKTTEPQGIAIDAYGNVWVANACSGTVTELNASGITVATYTVGTQPEHIAIDASGNVWVANWESETVSKLFAVTTGPQYFPYSDLTYTSYPQFPGGGN